MASTLSPEKGSFTFTVGKLDAGMAILIGSRAHLIEFPSILLPDGVGIGSIVSIDVHRNINEEEQQKAAFWKLQNDIYMMYGIHTPSPPVLKLRHVTQTSVTLEWPPLQLATSTLRSLDIYRSGQRLASIPNPATNTSTKLSSLQIATTYTFQLVLRTTAGTFPSNIVEVKTHSIEDTSGISVCFGTILDSDVGEGSSAAGRKEELKNALESMGAKWSEKIQIDTTHFVCTTSLSLASMSASAGASGPKTGVPGEEPGVEYQKAMQLSIPIVQPDWVLACYYGKKMVPTAPYYLGTSIPPLVQGHNRVQSISQRQLSQPHPPLPPNTPTTSSTAASQDQRRTSTASPPTKSLPRNPGPQSNNPSLTNFITSANDGPTSADPTVPAHPPGKLNTTTTTTPIGAEHRDAGDDDDDEGSPTTPSGRNSAIRKRTGTMDKAFKFPPGGGPGGKSPGLTISPPPPVPPVPPIIVVHEAKESVDARMAAQIRGEDVKGKGKGGGVRGMPEPPTPDLDNDSSVGGVGGREEEDGGEIVEVDLS